MDSKPKHFTTKGLFVTPVALTSHYNFLTDLECYYMVLINKKKIKSRTATEMDGTLHTDFRKSETSRDIKKSF